MRLRSHIQKDGTIPLTDNQRMYLQKRAGSSVFIEIDRRTTAEKQGFLEGAIVPFFFYQHMRGVFRDFGDARYSLKKLFNVKKYINADGKTEIVADSMKLIYDSNTKTQEYINKCQEYFMQNGYQFPDSEDYKKWLMGDPTREQIYPPLHRLIEKYNKPLFINEF